MLYRTKDLNRKDEISDMIKVLKSLRDPFESPLKSTASTSTPPATALLTASASVPAVTSLLSSPSSDTGSENMVEVGSESPDVTKMSTKSSSPSSLVAVHPVSASAMPLLSSPLSSSSSDAGSERLDQFVKVAAATDSVVTDKGIKNNIAWDIEQRRLGAFKKQYEKQQRPLINSDEKAQAEYFKNLNKGVIYIYIYIKNI